MKKKDLKEWREIVRDEFKCYRQILKWTQKRLARELSISQSLVSNIEAGRADPSAYLLLHLALIANQPYFFGGRS